MNLNQNRAQLRGKKLDHDCNKALLSTHECGIKDNRKYCSGLIDASTECLLPKCSGCGAHVSNVTLIESEGRVDNKNCFNCNWTKDFVNFEVAKLCVNKLSGSYNTDVTQYECCNQWAVSEGK